MRQGELSAEWIEANMIVLLDDRGQPSGYVARSAEIATEVLARSPEDTPLRRAAEASLVRRYDGGLLLPLCGAGTAALLLFSGGGEVPMVLYGLLIGASTIGYLYASRPPFWKLVKRRLPSGTSRLKASAMSGLGTLLVGAFGSFAGGGIIFLAFACACLPLVGMAMPVATLVQYVRNQ
jgi:hypothetical protein